MVGIFNSNEVNCISAECTGQLQWSDCSTFNLPAHVSAIFQMFLNEGLSCNNNYITGRSKKFMIGDTSCDTEMLVLCEFEC